MNKGLRKEHEFSVKAIQQGISSWKYNDPITLSFGNAPSNITRKKQYTYSKKKIGIDTFNRFLSIDTQAKIATVEPRITMQELVKYTLPYGLIPKIVPEFKGITVGGAINGGAAESSSFKYGIFNDICHSYEVILSDGSLTYVSEQENNDLFYGIAASYGSLGLITSAKIELIDAKPWVLTRYHPCSSPEEAVDLLQSFYTHPSPPDFLDGIIFSEKHAVVITATMVHEKEIPPSLPRLSLSSRLSSWYFQHVKDLPKPHEEALPIVDYLFRYDQGAFWMGAYLLSPKFIYKFLLEGIFHKEKRSSFFTEKEVTAFRNIQGPGHFTRCLVYDMASSIRLYKLLHKGEKWISRRAVIQDFCMPEDEASSFIHDVKNLSNIYPLWLCPIKRGKGNQIFSPHMPSHTSSSPEYCINVGVYGIPSTLGDTSITTKHLENRAHMRGGRKVLYSYSYYSQQEFWEIYSQKAYLSLREKYHGKKWRSIEEKVLSSL